MKEFIDEIEKVCTKYGSQFNTTWQYLPQGRNGYLQGLIHLELINWLPEQDSNL